MHRLAVKQEDIACHYYCRLQLPYEEEQQEASEKCLGLGSSREFLSVYVCLQYGYEYDSAYPYRKHGIERRHRGSV